MPGAAGRRRRLGDRLPEGAFGYEALASRLIRLSQFDPSAVNALLAELKASAESFVRAGTSGKIVCEITAFMRYAGQGWEIPVALPDGPFGDDAACALEELFRANYERFFGRAIEGLEGLEIEIVTWSVKATDERPEAAPLD